MIGNDVISQFFNNVFEVIVNAILAIFTVIIKIFFANKYIALIVFFILINLLAIILMKKDKQYSQIPDAKRIRESTLLMTAIVGGAFGEYYAMYKYKHKTLHKKFLYGVPIAMVFQFALLSYNIFLGILV